MTLVFECSRDFDEAVFVARYVGAINDILLTSVIPPNNTFSVLAPKLTLEICNPKKLHLVSSDWESCSTRAKKLPSSKSAVSIHHSIDPNPVMLRSTLRRSTRIINNASPKAIKPRITKRYASSGSGGHAKSSDLPWAIPSLIITVPVV